MATEKVEKNNVNATETVEDRLKNLRMDEKVSIRSIAGWNVGFSRKDSSFMGDVSIPMFGTIQLSRNEIMAQIQYGNNLFTGIDGKGSHATIYIEDADTRMLADFDSTDGKTKQNILTEEKATYMFELKTYSTFLKHLEESVVTRAEKYAFMNFIKKLKFNDYEKIKASEEHCHYTLDKIE